MMTVAKNEVGGGVVQGEDNYDENGDSFIPEKTEQVSRDNKTDLIMEPSSENRPFWRGNITPWWVIATIYMLIFVLYLGFGSFAKIKTVGFILHTIMALLFIVGCAWNIFHTPSHGPRYRSFHIVLGRIAMASGFFVVGSGYFLVLTGQTSLNSTAQTTFMITGGFQIVMQSLVIYFIRFDPFQKRLQNNDTTSDLAADTTHPPGPPKGVVAHMISANILFYCCAFGPALNRTPQVFGFEDTDWWVVMSMILGCFFCFVSIFFFMLAFHKKSR